MIFGVAAPFEGLTGVKKEHELEQRAQVLVPLHPLIN